MYDPGAYRCLCSAVHRLSTWRQRVHAILVGLLLVGQIGRFHPFLRDALHAESETPSEPESGTPSGENLLANALAGNEELLGGDSWAAKDGAWAGPLQEVREGAESYAQQAFVEETRSDGSKGICYRFYSEATKGWHTTGNTFGISSLLEANKSYKLTVSLKLTVPNPGEKDSIEVGVTNSTENSGPVTVTAKDEWQTVTYTFKTGFIFDGAYIYVGPSGVNNSIVLGEIQAGFNLLIDSISLVEE